MYAPKPLTVINRPLLDPITNMLRWNLVASEIGGTILLPEVPEDAYRQSAVLDALSKGVSEPAAIINYANSIYGTQVEDPQREVDGAKERYQAATGFEALALAVADGSVLTATRPAMTAPTDIADFLALLAKGHAPESAAKVSKASDYEQLARRACTRFGALSLYAALRLALEHGVVSGRTPMQTARFASTSRFAAPYQVGFRIPARELALTPKDLLIGRELAAGLGRTAVAAKNYVTQATISARLSDMYEKLEAHNEAEAVTKLVVLGLAEPPKKPLHFTGNVTANELSTLIMIAQGFEHAEIGNKLGITKQTVNSRIRNINEKTGSANRVTSVLCMFQAGVFKVELMTNLPE